jgi:hypothetical protein
MAQKKRKRRSSARRQGGGGVMMAMRSGFRRAAQSATGARSNKPQSTASKVANWAFTIVLLGVAAYLILKRLHYIG